jgi:hypothetical protein
LKNPTADREAYVRKVQEGMHRYTQEIMAELERHKRLVAGLQAEKLSLEEKAHSLAQLGLANTALRALADSLQGEIRRLQEEATSLRAAAEVHKREHDTLEAQLERVRVETERESLRYAEVEQQNSNLANLYVASYRLHGTLDRKEVLAAIQEIIANLIGSEEAGIFELDRTRQALSFVAGFGVEASRCPEVPLGSGLIGRAALTGEIYVAGQGDGAEAAAYEDDLTACIPLSLDGQVTGAIAIFRLLPQKSGVEEIDRELFELLATHAATALYCATLHARQPAGLAAAI